MIRPLARYAAILSDLDGTLIDSHAAVRRAWTGFARRHGLDADEVVHLAEGRPAVETALQLAPDAPEEPALLGAAELADTDGIIALPGAEALLHDSRLTVAIVTSCFHQLAVARLHAAGLPIPDTLVTADQVTRGKPDPEAFLLAAQRLGVDPGECLVLEDAAAGVIAGCAAGMTVAAVRGTHSDEELRGAGADLVVASVAELRRDARWD